MKTFLDCFPCFLSQALRAGRIAGADEKKIREIVNETAGLIQSFSEGLTPPEMGEAVYAAVSRVTGVEDPFKEVKARNIKKARELFPLFQRDLEDAPNRLEKAVRLAIAGNVIDLGIKGDIDIFSEVKETAEAVPGIFDYEKFRERSASAETILVLGDNAGEAVFDKFLLSEMGEEKKIYYAVRDKAVINDVTVKEAMEAGIDEYAEIISSGTKAPGTLLTHCSDEFLEIFKSADLVVSKGQGNYEALSEADRDIFFLLKAKCPVIARDLNTAISSPVLCYKEKYV